MGILLAPGASHIEDADHVSPVGVDAARASDSTDPASSSGSSSAFVLIGLVQFHPQRARVCILVFSTSPARHASAPSSSAQAIDAVVTPIQDRTCSSLSCPPRAPATQLSSSSQCPCHPSALLVSPTAASRRPCPVALDTAPARQREEEDAADADAWRCIDHKASAQLSVSVTAHFTV
ncbi:hypothetical protein K466DRAFT_157438 [Polyporus arcularius HHB13444]|uniref:Uncharacterized protein n=1 Tax=Polyporus arcularius HHB13444 TaxID=1314778 RepID=A0A5C3P9A1_9APHY|nr:hypothetical protein K466DRAFT_157438 [Polyporus arcularius HHB13444]